MDLYRPGVFVAQFDPYACVASSMQTMINIMSPGKPDRTRATQTRLYDRAREISPWEELTPGASFVGWIGELEELGHGDFEELSTDTRGEALRVIARQIRLTGKPAGISVWRGEHAWVVSGFKATADPAYTDDFSVTHLWIEDPWSGRVSGIWGAGLRPDTLVSAKALAADLHPFASIHRPQYGEKGKFVIIAPVG